MRASVILAIASLLAVLGCVPLPGAGEAVAGTRPGDFVDRWTPKRRPIIPG